MRSDERAGVARIRDWLPAVGATGGFFFDLLAWWPGQMSFDSAYAWWQARGGDTTDIVPPAFVFAWRALLPIADGPQAMLVLQLALFWGGLAWLVRGVGCTSRGVIGAMMLIGLAPVPLLLRGHVWTDVAFFAALTCASGALALAHARRRGTWLLPALPLLAYAATLRHNALPAMLPFAVWFAWLALRGSHSTPTRHRVHIGVATLAFLVALVAANRALDASVQRQVPLWPSLAQFDLAAVSVATGRMLLPDFMIGPGLDVAELEQAFREWSNTHMLANTRHGMSDPFMRAYTPAQLTLLRDAWLGALVTYPTAWIAHRWQVTCALFGTHSRAWPHELIYVDEEVRYRDTPPITGNASALHNALMRVAETARSSLWLAAWPCLLAGLIAFPFAWRRRASTAASPRWSSLPARGCMALRSPCWRRQRSCATSAGHASPA